MKKLLILVCVVLPLAACVGMSSTDGDSTKQWIKIDSSRQDLSGKITDVCFRLDLRFSPSEAINAFNTDMACITKCCWYEERKSVVINFNEFFARDLAAYGRAIKYKPEQMTFHISYSSFLGTIHGKAEPSANLKAGGLVMLDGSEVKEQAPYLIVGHEPYKAAVYDESLTGHESTYLFKAQEPAGAAKAAAQKPVSITDAIEREEQLQKMLAYEREQAVLLLKRFHGKDIDAYILSIDKAQRAKGQVLLANDRQWITTKIGSPIYKVTCRVAGKLGKTQGSMKPFPIDCGSFRVDLDDKTVSPMDGAARAVVAGEYKN